MRRPLARTLLLSAPGWARNELWRRARAVPSLDLRFADSKSLTDAVSGQSLITFTRASDATFVNSQGVLTTASSNVPRFDHNPTTGESLGLLPEEQRQNLIVQSENLGTTWTTTGLLAFGSGSTLNATTAPDGLVTADLATENTSLSEHRIETAAISWAANTTYTLTIFAKASGRSRIDFFGVGGGNFTGGRNAAFNLTTGTVIPTDGTTASVQSYPNGWYRLRMTFTTSAVPAASSIFIRFLDNSNNISYTGDGTSGIFLWGAQLEAGAFATSYIPTTGTAATRSADVASITGSAFSGWYRQDQGTLFANALSISPSSLFPCAASANDGTSSNRIQVGRTNSSGAALRVFVTSGGVAAVDGMTVGSTTAGAFGRVAFGYQLNNFGGATNGSLATPDTSGAVPVVNQLQIGDAVAGGPLNGCISRLIYWPQRLSNEVLQRITL